jgi:hypothetical protein
MQVKRPHGIKKRKCRHDSRFTIADQQFDDETLDNRRDYSDGINAGYAIALEQAWPLI